MSSCSACGAAVQPGFAFCPRCGGKLTAACPACATACAPDFAFCPKCGARLGTPPAEPTDVATLEPGTPVPGEGDRRVVTVLFADVSGFTALGERLDPGHGDPALALGYYREALELVEQVGEPQLLFPCYDGLATLYLDMGQEARGRGVHGEGAGGVRAGRPGPRRAAGSAVPRMRRRDDETKGASMTNASMRSPVQPGEPAPDFTVPAAHGEGTVSVADYRGRSPVLLALFRGLY